MLQCRNSARFRRFDEGKNDPSLALMGFDAERREIWLNENSLWAGVKLMLGAGDPKEDYKDKVAKARLGSR